MAKQFLFDLNGIDLNAVHTPIEGIRAVIPQRYEFEMLTAIVSLRENPVQIVAYKDITVDDFWTRGHIPGRPLMPGVMMIEAGAQLCAWYTMMTRPDLGFIGFARCDDVSFRGTVVPPGRLYILCQLLEMSKRRAVGKTQGIFNDRVVFEATITGMAV